jgi:DNA-binding response OmpR family regulator
MIELRDESLAVFAGDLTGHCILNLRDAMKLDLPCLPAGAEMTAKKKRVLVVDDDEQILESMELALDAHGYDVVIAHDGNEGLASVERDSPDLVILDVVMPRRNGFNVLECLNLMSTVNPRVILVTDNDEPRHREFAKSRGVDAFVPKPFDVEMVLDIVDNLLRR